MQIYSLKNATRLMRIFCNWHGTLSFLFENINEQKRNQPQQLSMESTHITKTCICRPDCTTNNWPWLQVGHQRARVLWQTVHMLFASRPDALNWVLLRLGLVHKDKSMCQSSAWKTAKWSISSAASAPFENRNRKKKKTITQTTSHGNKHTIQSARQTS